MILHKEQIDSVRPDGTPQKVLWVSFINKEGKVDFISYPIPDDQMFEWRYSSQKDADPEFQMWDMENNCPKVDEYGNPVYKRWMSYDNKWVKRHSLSMKNGRWDDLPENRLNEILCSFGKNVDYLFEQNVPITWFCDIETDVDPEIGFSSPEDAITPINTISMTKFPQTIIFSRKNLKEDEKVWIQEQIDQHSEKNGGGNITKGYKFEFRYYETEKEMLVAFLDFIRDIPSIAGWNFLGFDWLYIYNRAKKNEIDIDAISPSRKSTLFNLTPRAGGNTIKVNIPMHKLVYDYLLVFKTWDQTVEHVENHTLDYISNRVLGIKKVPHQWGFTEFYREHFKEYVFYNCIDTILIEQIDLKIHTANIWFALANLLRIEANMAFSTIKPTETVMCNFVYPQFKVFPKKKRDIPKEQEGYEGAFVWPSRPGIYKHICGLDFASLYPSIMRQFLVSPESFIKKDPDYIPKDDEIKMTSGAVYKKDPNSMIPSILTYYFNLRKQTKNDMKQADAEKQFLQDILTERLKTGK